MISARSFCPGQLNSLQNAGNNTEIKPLRRAANYSGGTYSGAFTMYQTQRELRDYAIYNDNDIIGFIEVWNRPGAQKKNSMGQMTSV